ncbi:hypothetical protein GCM10009530_11990 [Microbispora corallina]|uniref:Uncharacterized protein n=1 Tax=Microbispora corallina TaxID=83302 RepID=A0ABQ4FTF4_9ACTN|nr:hypothetical protein Mco01_11040 [Microbispora corallina]
MGGYWVRTSDPSLVMSHDRPGGTPTCRPTWDAAPPPAVRELKIQDRPLPSRGFHFKDLSPPSGRISDRADEPPDSGKSE